FFLGILLVLFALSSCEDEFDLEISDDASAQEKVESINSWLDELQADRKFNGSVLLVKDGQSMLAKGYGFTNYEKNEELTANSSFRLASVSKQFTAAGIMLLQEKGSISYDDLVSAYIDDFPYKNVTIRSLLNQCSGIPDIYIELAIDNRDDFDLLTNQKVTELLINENRSAKREPFEKFEYSNTNYILLARLVEVISGKSFEDYMKEELFEPLGMENTRVWNLLSAKTDFTNKCGGFKIDGNTYKEVTPDFLDGVAGDGAVFSSVNDFLIWDNFWYENDLLSEFNLAEAFKKPQLNNSSSSDYGFGWVITDDGAWHNGSWLAARTYYKRNTKNGTSVVVLDNSSNDDLYDIGEEISNIWL
ncbi:MAG: serine hydrolase domain-containing protein, partial [Bacteroidota bacterium]